MTNWHQIKLCLESLFSSKIFMYNDLKRLLSRSLKIVNHNNVEQKFKQHIAKAMKLLMQIRYIKLAIKDLLYPLVHCILLLTSS